jgi:hypothetical protein
MRKDKEREEILFTVTCLNPGTVLGVRFSSNKSSLKYQSREVLGPFLWFILIRSAIEA